MKGFLSVVKGICTFLNVIAGISLSFLMLLTIADVALRFFKMPIPGTYELVAYSGAIVIGFSLPLTSWLRGHIFVDFLVLSFSKKVQNSFHLTTRCVVIALFLLLGWNLMKYGVDLFRSGEVTPTLRLPFYPIAYGVGLCCFMECLVMVGDIYKIRGGKYE
ncbi:MAG: TRAP transporter small permease [Deltaproteobacteria bacterium]|nr:TRAP transporter small permease [Deltaproteobacteria bacterium]